MYGSDFLNRPGWVNMDVQKIAQNTGVPDSWTTWLPASKDYSWVNHPWGNADYMVQYGPWRLQIRAQWLKHHTFTPDNLLHQAGWFTLKGCEGLTQC